MVAGSVGVGKSTLLTQFMHAAYAVEVADSPQECGGQCVVTIVLNGEQSTLQFIELDLEQLDVTHRQDWKAEYDALLCVYSVDSRHSFDEVLRGLDELLVPRGHNHACLQRRLPVILVANKTDLVRRRDISFDEGKRAAKRRECKFTETSATIGHNVDQLLVGVLQQIRLSLRHAKLHQSSSLSSALSASRSRGGSAAVAGGDPDCRRSVSTVNGEVVTGVRLDGRCLLQARQRVVAKILSSLPLGSSLTTSSVCENLYVL